MIELSVIPDHIHTVTVVQLPPTMSVSQALHLLKGASSYELIRRQPLFRYRYPRGCFWSPRKFYRNVGDADTTTMLEYVKNQRLQQASLDNFSTSGSSHGFYIRFFSILIIKKDVAIMVFLSKTYKKIVRRV